jgi:hypothetical protein
MLNYRLTKKIQYFKKKIKLKIAIPNKKIKNKNHDKFLYKIKILDIIK